MTPLGYILYKLGCLALWFGLAWIMIKFWPNPEWENELDEDD